jgi:hypothetical protein
MAVGKAQPASKEAFNKNASVNVETFKKNVSVTLNTDAGVLICRNRILFFVNLLRDLSKTPYHPLPIAGVDQ